jgi:mannosyltransferase OCH1-like enzyme
MFGPRDKIIGFLVLGLVIIYLSQNKHENFETTISSSNIPKIIHQTAPRDISKWKDEWKTCQATWKKHFPPDEYSHMMWYDEDLDNLIKNDFAWFYPLYQSYDAKIKKIDIARYFILYKYGGIYADMDYMCTRNFYDLMPNDKVSISESPYKENEHIQNALMISPPNNPFWMKVVVKAIERVNSPSVLYATGPKLVTDVYFENPDEVNVLEIKLYNPKVDTVDFDADIVITKHLGTKTWI